MNRLLSCLACLPLLAGAAEPQRAPNADLEPAVATSPEPKAQTPPAAQKPKKAVGESAAKAATTAASAPKSGETPGAAKDRLALQATQVTGNRELPRVLYVVPWKRPNPGDLSGRPPNSLLDEVLAPVDRDVFQRQNRYYDALKPDGGP